MSEENKPKILKLQELQIRHKALDENIAWGYSFYLDDADMQKMKKEKLLVKEQIYALEQELFKAA
jgi:hypothetical protein